MDKKIQTAFPLILMIIFFMRVTNLKCQVFMFVSSLLRFCKHKSRSHGKRQKERASVKDMLHKKLTLSLMTYQQR